MLNSKYTAGFSLLELLLVIALSGILTASSVSVFSSYTRSQSFQSGVADFVAALNKARSRSITQVKPAVCGTRALQGYQVVPTVPGNSYRVEVLCGGATSIVEPSKNLPNQVTFVAGSSTPVLFNVSTGIVNTVKTITITGYGFTRVITVSSTGSISVL